MKRLFKAKFNPAIPYASPFLFGRGHFLFPLQIYICYHPKQNQQDVCLTFSFSTGQKTFFNLFDRYLMGLITSEHSAMLTEH